MIATEISVLGCGWLGLPLAEYLVQKGYIVKGSTSVTDDIALLQEKKILSYYLEITDTAITCDDINSFLECSILIVCFPPPRRSDVEHYHIAQIQQLIKALLNTSVQQILFISSTSVYPNLNKEVTEEETALTTKGSGKALKAAEHMFQTQSHLQTTILRLGGLIGYDRMPQHYIQDKKELKNANAQLNIIHRDDCIELIYQIIKQQVWGEVFNACADKHPTRKDFYTATAVAYQLPLPEFTDEAETDFKMVKSDKIKSRLGYSFKYPDPLQISRIEKSLHQPTNHN